MIAARPYRLSPFDAIASEYDRQFTDTLVGRAQRDAVWDLARHTFPKGARLLELNCGTGVDAVFLAGLGMQVVALDQSEQMIHVAQERVRKSLLASRLQFRTWDIEELHHYSDLAGFDGVFSNFGGLNCVSDLSNLSKALASLIRPGGNALLCILSKSCAWEMLYFTGKLKLSKAFRRWHNSGCAWTTKTGTVHVKYPSVAQLKHTMLPHFRYVGHRAVGLAVPPSYLEEWTRHHRKFLTMATWFDRLASRAPGLRNFGDHCCLLFERVQDDGVSFPRQHSLSVESSHHHNP